MTWLAWRQFRPSAIVGGALLLAVVLLLAITGPMLAHDYHVYLEAVKNCRINGCGSAEPTFVDRFPHVDLLGTLLIALPGGLGVFWGAPLVTRELENGTHRLAWTQSVSRTRWILTKLGLVGLAAVALTGLFSLAFSWWESPLDRMNLNRLDPVIFDQRAIVPVGYAVFGFALGVLAGVLLRRTFAAMGVTLATFIAVRLLFQDLVRPHLYAAVHKVYSLAAAGGIGFQKNSSGISVMGGKPDIPGAWILSSRVVDAAGHSPTSSVISQLCPGIARGLPPSHGKHHVVRVLPPGQRAFESCLSALSRNYHLAVSYQPGSRFWLFQWTETAIFVAAGLALAGLATWVVRGRLQ
jgi:hypothetical protein